MTSYHLNIASPEGSIYNGPAVQLSVRGIEGDLAILAGHIPFLTVLKEGECRVYVTEDDVREAICTGGMLSVGNDGKVQLLSSGFKWKRK
ncbi:MAG: F0F1 ATP synthase subunit epsilon [Lachnospiraceae bacterium]|nr:F0F1 ATP synthase subunit epsilon [Lachnospiraceae bacterium]